MSAAVSLPSTDGRSPAGPFGRAAESLIALTQVSKDYDTGGGLVHAMREVDLTIAHGEFVAIVGTSGSGKSTMMNILGCLDRPTRGTYTLAGIDVGARASDSRAIVRNRVIGFIFQGFNLLPRTTALENCELPLQYRGVGARQRRSRARAALQAVGLGDRMDHKPNQLSGGQQQRVAIARALVTDPPLLLADEPTGNLDTRTSLEVLALLQKLNRERGITIVLVTHERDIAACASRVVTMRDGRVVSDETQDAPLDAAAELDKLPTVEGNGASAQERAHASPAAGDGSGGPVPFGVYPMMLLGEAVGLAVGMGYVAFVLQLSVWDYVWVPALTGELVKAWAGARWARRKLGFPSTNDQRTRIALSYTLAVTGVAAVLFPRYAPPRFAMPALANGWSLLAHGAGQLVGFTAVLATAFLLRYLLLTLFNPRR
jgi:putative ABC transport system ATP-binding protein